ncbi:MAG: right-handed parallel beta-helix repeat-containing protein, partial [Planctomycetota bacterium]
MRLHSFCRCFLALLPVLLAATAAIDTAMAAEPLVIHVSPQGSDSAAGLTPQEPLASLQGARDLLRRLRGAGRLDRPVEVRLADGLYTMTEPVVFAPADSGTAKCPITFTAAAGARPTISGGRPITGWRRLRENIFVTELPGVKEGKWTFRQLYVGGELRPRARTPNEGFLRVAGFPDGGKNVHYHTDCKRFEFKPGDIRPDWTNLGDVEVIVYHFWTDSHLPIESVDTETNIVTFKHKAGKVFTDDFTAEGARYIVENVFEGLDAPGEWYLNRKTSMLFYVARAGEDPARLEVIAPVAKALIRFDGKPQERQYVEHLRFCNLKFMHTHFELPPGNSNDKQGSASVPAAIQMLGARNCAFENCEAANIGTWAFELGPGCRQNEFRANRLHDIAAGAFRVDGGVAGSHPLTHTAENRIVDNEIGPYGVVYPSAVGVLLMNTYGNEVCHNHIHHGGYTGISSGWVWGYGPSINRDNLIERNHIHHIGQGLLSDMGGIYTLGISPGTTIRGNLIHDVEANHYGGWGIYHDEGSSYLLVEDNVVYNTKFATFNIHYSKEVTVRNNIFACGRLEQLSRGKMEPHRSVYFENNIVYWTEGELASKNWQDKPYEYYFMPPKGAGSKGVREMTSTFEFDYNLYFNPTLKPDELRFGKLTFAEWQKQGKDRHSVYADPKFVDPANHDYRLQPDSPALRLGFRPIDISDAG